MLNLDIRFSLPFPYQNEFVVLPAGEHSLVFQLEEGTHAARSTPVDLGVAHKVGGRRLLGWFSFEYTYDPHRRVITVPGVDFHSARSMCLTTVPEGTTEYCQQRVASGFVDDELTANPGWNYTTPLTPGLREVFTDVLRTVNSRVIAALQAQPSLIVQVRKHAPVFSVEEHQAFLVVYRDGEFQGLHEPGRDYGPGAQVLTIESVFGGEVTLSYGEAFANVIGSTNDPKIAGLTWLQLWARQFGVYPIICTSYQSNGFACGSQLVGGHVISGTQAKTVAAGSNAVYIFPICIQHNNNDNVYMQGLKYLTGIWLKNYMGT